MASRITKQEREAISLLFATMAAAVPQLATVVSHEILAKLYEAEMMWDKAERGGKER